MSRKLLRPLTMVLALCMFLSVPALAYSAKTVTLKPSGYELQVSEYAPGQSASSPHIGGNYGVATFDDFEDLGSQMESYRDAVNWWLSSGVTNGGETWTRFGVTSPFYRYDLAFFLYRYFSVTNDDGMWFYEDVPLNAAYSEVYSYKFADPTHAVRWTGIMGGVGNDLFDPYGVVTREQLLTVLYRLINYEDGTVADGAPEFAGLTTTQVNKNFAVAVPAVEDPDAVLAEYGMAVSEFAKEAVAALISAGVYTPQDGAKGAETLNKIQVISLLYDICAGAGGRQQRVEAFTDDALYTFDSDYTSSGESFSINGTEEEPIAGTNLIYVTNGAKVTLTNASIYSNNVTTAYGYPLAYRWGDSDCVLVSGEGSVLTLESPTIDFEYVVERQHSGFSPTCGATIIVKNATYLSECAAKLCYNGTLIYEDTSMNRSSRIHSSDFFSGVVVYNNCKVNYENFDEEGKQIVGNGFNDEASSTYILDSYYAAGPGTMTGVSTFYAEDSELVMSKMTSTNNTSILTDITSVMAVNCDVQYTEGIANVQKEGKLQMKFIDCGEIELLPLAATDPTASASYDIFVFGAEFGSFSSIRIYLDASTYFDRPLNVYVQEGCTLEIYYSGDTAPEVNQDSSVKIDHASYEDKRNTISQAPNTGVVTIEKVDWIG